MKKAFKIIGTMVLVVVIYIFIGRIDGSEPPYPLFVGEFSPYQANNNGLEYLVSDPELEDWVQANPGLKDAVRDLYRTGTTTTQLGMEFDGLLSIAERRIQKALLMPIWESRPLYDSGQVSMHPLFFYDVSVLLANAHIQIDAEDLRSAIDSLNTITKVLRRVQDDPHISLVGYMLELAVKEHFSLAALRITNHEKAGEFELRNIVEALNSIPERNGAHIITVFKNEYIYSRRILEKMKQDPVKLLDSMDSHQPEYKPPSGIKKILMSLVVPYAVHPNRLIASSESLFQAYIDSAVDGKCDYHKRTETEEDVSPLVILRPNFFRYLVADVRDYSPYLARRCLTSFLLDAVRISAGTRRFALAHDKYPKESKELLASYIGKPPLDRLVSHRVSLSEDRSVVRGTRLPGAVPTEHYTLQRARCNDRSANCVQSVQVEVDYNKRQQTLISYYNELP